MCRKRCGCRTAAVRFSLALTKRPISRNSPRWAAAKVPDLHMSLTAMARVPPMVPPMVHMVDLMDMDRQMQATCQEDRDISGAFSEGNMGDWDWS